MSLFNILVIAGVVILLLAFAGWYTINKFDNIESGKTGRRKHIEEDVEVDERKTEA